MAWNSTGNIKGPKGDKGDKGDPGEIPDSNWIALTNKSGIPGRFEYREYGNVASVRGALSGSFSKGTTTVSGAKVPSSILPGLTNARGHAYFNDSNSGGVTVTTDGDVVVYHAVEGQTFTLCHFAFTYLKG